VFMLIEVSWTYALSLYFVLISFTTIGFGDVIPSKSNYMILVGLMLLIGLALVSTVLQIIQKQIHALADDMKDKIDKDYQTALEEMGGGSDLDERTSIETVDGPKNGLESGKKASHKKKGGPDLDAVIARMPLRSRILYHVMPKERRKALASHVNKRTRVGVAWVQTDAYLMEADVRASYNPNY